MSYTPQDIRYMDIIIGPGDVTSPYVSMDEPFDGVEAEVVTTNILAVDMFEPLSVTDLLVLTTILLDGAMVEPASICDSTAFNYKMLDVAISEPKGVLYGEAVTITIISGQAKERVSKMNGDFGSNILMVEPVSAIEAVVVNPILIDCAIFEPRSSMYSDTHAWNTICADMNEPWSELFADVLTHNSIACEMAEYLSSLSSVSVTATYIDGAMSEPVSIAMAALSDPATYTPIKFNNSCGL